ncbi:MAG: insulinase family protein [Candidatus Omnitrophica bacterium]|nr:insulinase family protein [Candidatus Omnitrophota bacterium]
MRKIVMGFLVVFLALNIFPQSFSSEILSSKQVLDNGLTVLISEIPTSPEVSVFGLVKAGSATEGEFLGSGLSHMIEHMVFKGTTKRKVGEIAAQIQAVGGTINASTSKDITIFTISVPFKEFDVALDVLSDMLRNAAFDVEELKKEKEVIVSEIRMDNDQPDRKVSDLAFNTVYTRHPYRHPTIGYESLFRELTREDALKYYKTMYAPNNMIISVAGHVDSQEALAKVKKQFEDFPRQMDVPRNLPVEPQQITPRYYEEGYPTEQTRLALMFRGVGILNKDLYALDVLASILGEGESSRLYLNVYKKKQLVYSISAYDYTPMDEGFFGIEALLDENNLASAVNAVWEEIRNIQAKGVTPDELQKAKTRVLAQYILGQQTSSEVADRQANDEALTGDSRFSDKYVKAIQGVNANDIKLVAKEYLKESISTEVVLKPKSEESSVPAAKANEQAAVIQKLRLDNGITVLLREDHTFPIVSMDIVMQAGTLQEPEALNGISNLAAFLLTQGTKTKTAEEIAKATDSLGASLSGFSGRNSIGITAQCLSKDLPVMLNLIEDVFKNPIFLPEEISKAKAQVKSDIKLKEDNISQVTNSALRKELFLKHPLRFDAEGTVESVDKITRADIEQFYHHFAVSSNMVISVFGDINAKNILNDLSKRFGALKGNPAEIKNFTEVPPAEPRQKELSMKKEQAMVMVGFQGPTLHDADRYGVEVLTAILGSSFNGRMFKDIRDQLGKAYSLGGGYTPGPDMGLISFYTLTTGADADKVRELMSDEIKKIQETDVSADELKEIQTYLKGTFAAGLETNASLGLKAGLDELYGLGFEDYKNYEKAIDAVTPKDIKRLALQYLDLNKSAIVITRPELKH